MSNKKEALSELLNRRPVNTGNIINVNTENSEKGKDTINTTSEKKKATFDLDKDLHTELKIFAAKQNKKMVEIVEIAIREYMNNN